MRAKKEKPSVLVIDHDSDVLLAVFAALDKEGYAVATAPSSLAGMRFVAERHPDVVVAGVGSGDLYGLELLSRIRAASILAKVIFLVGDSDWTVYESLVQAGCDDLLPRPPEATELVWAVERATTGGLAASRADRHGMPRWA